MGYPVTGARARTVARYLRGHSGIAGIQGPQGHTFCDLIVPAPYRIEVRATRGVQYLMERYNALVDDMDMRFIIAYTPDMPVSHARVITSLENFAPLLGAHYLSLQGSFEDKEGR